MSSPGREPRSVYSLAIRKAGPAWLKRVRSLGLTSRYRLGTYSCAAVLSICALLFSMGIAGTGETEHPRGVQPDMLHVVVEFSGDPNAVKVTELRRFFVLEGADFTGPTRVLAREVRTLKAVRTDARAGIPVALAAPAERAGGRWKIAMKAAEALPPGVYDYELVYEVPGVVQRDNHAVQLSWPVTGVVLDPVREFSLTVVPPQELLEGAISAELTGREVEGSVFKTLIHSKGSFAPAFTRVIEELKPRNYLGEPWLQIVFPDKLVLERNENLTLTMRWDARLERGAGRMAKINGGETS